jgi:hypothetical protein
VIGATNVAGTGMVSGATVLSTTNASSVDPHFQVDASNSSNPTVTAIEGIANVAQGAGLSGTGGLYGVYGKANGADGIGVYGESGGSGTTPGVWGVNTGAGPGILAYATSGVDLDATGAGRLRQQLQASAGAHTGAGTTYQKGEMLRDTNGELWLCTGSGAPGTWVNVAHLSPGATSGGAITYLSQSIRLLDTRVGFPALNTPAAPTRAAALTPSRWRASPTTVSRVPATASGRSAT